MFQRLSIWLRPGLTALSVAAGIAAATFGLGGCGGGGGTTRSTATPTPTSSSGCTTLAQASGWTVSSDACVQTQKKWTLLVYMNGANDLEEFGTINANEMESVGSNNDVNIVIQFKRIKGQYDSADGDWGGTRRYYLTKDSSTTHIGSTLLSSNSSLDMGNPTSLQNFIQWGIATYPADRYALVVWNHGAGWRSQKIPGRSVVYNGSASWKGVSYDDQFNTHIDTIQLPAAIDMGNGKKWDLLAWDSSLMQMLEVSYEIRDKVQYIVGSEESPPGLGYPYHLFLSDLEANPTWDGKQLGTDIAQQTFTFYGGDTSAWYSNVWGQTDVTQSVLDASKIAAVTASVNTLGSALLSAKTTSGTAIATARDNADSYAYPDYQENKDLLDFCSRLSPVTDSGVKSAVSQVQSAVNAAVQYNTAGSGHSGSHGIAVFIATPSQYKSDDIEQANGFGQRYSLLTFAKDAPNWQNFLVNGPQ